MLTKVLKIIECETKKLNDDVVVIVGMLALACLIILLA